MTTGWGIIGFGNHAERKMAPAINNAKDSRLAAIYSRQLAGAEELSARHHAEAAYDSIPSLLRDPKVDAVYIASPNSLHKEHTILAARAGKHVLVEKPMALTVEDCQAMIDECARHKVQLGVGFHMRHHPVFQQVRRLIQDGVLGDLSLLHGQWAFGRRGVSLTASQRTADTWWGQAEMAGGGITMGVGVHVIDLLRYLAGKEVVEVTAMTNASEGNPLESQAVALLRFAGGWPMATVIASQFAPDSRNDLMVYGSHGRIWGQGAIGGDAQGTVDVATTSMTQTLAYEKVDLYQAEVEAFNQSIATGKPMTATGMDGLRVCQITQGLFLSAREHKAIRLPERT